MNTGRQDKLKNSVEKNKNILLFVTGTYLTTWILWIAAFRINGIFRIIGSFVPSGISASES